MKRDPHATLGATLDAQVDAKLAELQGELARVSKARQAEIDGLTQAIARLQAVKGAAQSVGAGAHHQPAVCGVGVSDTYTLDQIRAAFCVVFHESGEWWFDYLSSPQENEECTRVSWDSFVETLREQQEHERV